MNYSTGQLSVSDMANELEIPRARLAAAIWSGRVQARHYYGRHYFFRRDIPGLQNWSRRKGQRGNTYTINDIPLPDLPKWGTKKTDTPHRWAIYLVDGDEEVGQIQQLDDTFDQTEAFYGKESLGIFAVAYLAVQAILMKARPNVPWYTSLD